MLDEVPKRPKNIYDRAVRSRDRQRARLLRMHDALAAKEAQACSFEPVLSPRNASWLLRRRRRPDDQLAQRHVSCSDIPPPPPEVFPFAPEIDTHSQVLIAQWQRACGHDPLPVAERLYEDARRREVDQSSKMEAQEQQSRRMSCGTFYSPPPSESMCQPADTSLILSCRHTNASAGHTKPLRALGRQYATELLSRLDGKK